MPAFPCSAMRGSRGAVAISPTGAAFRLAKLDELDAGVVRVAGEAGARAALAELIWRPFGLDPVVGCELCERPVEIVHSDRDMPVPRAEVVRTPVVVE